MEKIDNSPEEEAVKDQAREFMTGLVGSAPETSAIANSTKGAAVVQAWKAAYKADKDDPDTLLDKLWASYDPETTSIWKMVYDEADSNETLDETIEIVTTLLT